jgi:hypothetical protein
MLNSVLRSWLRNPFRIPGNRHIAAGTNGLKRGSPEKMQQESAQILALQALAWLVADDELLSAFLSATGAGLGDLRARAGDVDFQGAILDFLMMDDQRVIAFCDQHTLPYTAPQAARAALPGGAPIHWT